MSYNSLKRIYPEQLREWIEVSEDEWAILNRELIEERLVTCKYDFNCTCGNSCTVYWNNIIMRNIYECPECGREFDNKEIEACGTLVYEINKTDFLEYSQDNIDYKKVVKDVRKVVPITGEINMEDKTVDKKKIFIGSSTEAKDRAHEVARYIDDLQGEAKTWDSKGIFIPGQYTFDCLINVAKKFDGAIFIFNGEDKTWYRNSRLTTVNEVRDNVLLEYGLFTGVMGMGKVIFVFDNDPKIATDLLGITYVPGKQTEYQMKEDLRAWLAQV